MEKDKKIENVAQVVNQHSKTLKLIVENLKKLKRKIEFLENKEKKLNSVDCPDLLKDIFNK